MHFLCKDENCLEKCGTKGTFYEKTESVWKCAEETDSTFCEKSATWKCVEVREAFLRKKQNFIKEFHKTVNPPPPG